MEEQVRFSCTFEKLGMCQHLDADERYDTYRLNGGKQGLSRQHDDPVEALLKGHLKSFCQLNEQGRRPKSNKLTNSGAC